MKLSEERIKLFQEVTQAIGVSGDESEVARILRKHYEGYCDEIIYDNLGSIFAVKRCKNRNNPLRVMVSGHLDEVGFRVGGIGEDGTLKLANANSGVVWEQVCLASRVIIKTRDGRHLPGAIISPAPHRLTPELRARPFPTRLMRVDVGCRDAQEVRKLGINIGDTLVLDGPFVELNNGERLLSKAFDNRYGCLMTIEALRALKDVELPYDLYIGATVQEEVGGRGAEASARLINPDFAIVMDCSPASDGAGTVALTGDGLGRLGEGVLNRFIDNSFIAFPQLLAFQRDICAACGVKCQPFSSTGGTDAGLIHRSNSGVLTFTHCICARGIHTPSSIIDVSDYEGALKTLVYALQVLTPEKIAQLRIAGR